MLFFDEVYDEDMTPGSADEMHGWFGTYVLKATVRLDLPSISLMLRNALRLLLSYNGTRATSNMDASAAQCRQWLALAKRLSVAVVPAVFRTGCQSSMLLQSHFCPHFLHAQHTAESVAGTGSTPACVTASWLTLAVPGFGLAGDVPRVGGW